MIGYSDTSLVLRIILGEPAPYVGLGKFDRLYASELVRVEALRTIDRLRIQFQWPNEEVVTRIRLLHDFLKSINEVPLQAPILQKASEPFPTIVKTLDALHIATALLMKAHLKKPFLFLTHDLQQGLAAMAVGLETHGFKSVADIQKNI